MEENSVEVIESVEVEKEVTEKPNNVYRQQKIASSGMGFLLQNLRASSSTTSSNLTVIKEKQLTEVSVIQPIIRKSPIRPTAVEYLFLNSGCGGDVDLEPVQIVKDCYNEGSTPKFGFSKDCSENNFVRSCKFSPDGTHLITDSVDRHIRIFDFDDGNRLVLKNSINNGDLVYDMVWDRFGDNFASTSDGSPIKLWNTNGEQMATYHGINHMDELDYAHSMTFNLGGDKLYGTYRGVIRRFDINRPGRQISEMKTYGECQSGQRSILSCIEMSPVMDGVYSIGSFGNCVGLYSDYTNSCDMLIPTKTRFVTCLGFSSNGQQIFIGGRKSSVIECYDIRSIAKQLASYSRPVTNAQRVSFRVDPDSRFLFSGSSNGNVLVFDLKNSPTDNSVVDPTWTINASKSAVTGLDLHPSKPFVATTHGQRVFPVPLSDDETDELEVRDENNYLQFTKDFDNSLKLWKF